MKKLILFLVAGVCFAQTPSLTNPSIRSVTYSSFHYQATSATAANQFRLLIAVAPTSCTTYPATGVWSEYFSSKNKDGAGVSSSGGVFQAESSGKTGGTTYNVCGQVRTSGTNVGGSDPENAWTGGTWTTAPMIQVTTAPPLKDSAGNPSYQLAIPAQKVNIAYAPEIVANTNTDTWTLGTTSGCDTIENCLAMAVNGQGGASSDSIRNKNKVIQLPAGSANTIFGSHVFDIRWPDEIDVPAGNVNNSDGSINVSGIAAHDGTALTWATGQQVQVTSGWSYGGAMPNGFPPVDNTGNNGDGRLYCVQMRDASNLFLYDGGCAGNGGVKLNLSVNGSGVFRMTQYPRPVKWIYIRTATPDSQFAPPLTSLGSANWDPKMAWLSPVVASRTGRYGPEMFKLQSDDGNFLTLATKIRFIGIRFTVPDDTVADGEVDPYPWNTQLDIGIATSDIITDRCSFSTPTLGQRPYLTMFINGVNQAIIHSWFDPSLKTYFGMNWNGITNNTGLYVGSPPTVDSHANDPKSLIISGNTRVTAGPFSYTFPSNLTAYWTGTPTNGAHRLTIGMAMANTSTLTIIAPVGITPTCIGGNCTVINRDVATGLSCDSFNQNGVNDRVQWTTDSAGEVTERMIYCWNMNADGSLSNGTQASVTQSDKCFYPGCNFGNEGGDLIAGTHIPGPITIRGNDYNLGGVPIYFSDDGGFYQRKSNLDFWRNWVHANWDGMVGSSSWNGNTYGSRNAAFETKGYNRFSFHGNKIENFNDISSAAGSVAFFLRGDTGGGWPGGADALFENNLCQHCAGGMTAGDLLFNSEPIIGTSGYIGPHFGTTAVRTTFRNNVLLDINEMGNENYTSTYSSIGTPIKGQGQWSTGPNLVQDYVLLNNTAPNMTGNQANFAQLADKANSGLYWGNNIMSINANYGAQNAGGDFGPVRGNGQNCNTGAVGRPLLECAWTAHTFTGNVFTSSVYSQSQLNTATWNTGNTTLGTDTALTSIWPSYTLNPEGRGSQIWLTQYDKYLRMMKLPANSAYLGKGADIDALMTDMGWAGDAQALFDASNNLTVTWTAMDPAACVVDVAAPGQLYGTFSRFSLDTGGTRARSITIPASNFTAHTTYDVAVRCERYDPKLYGIKSN